MAFINNGVMFALDQVNNEKNGVDSDALGLIWVQRQKNLGDYNKGEVNVREGGVNIR